ncbi:MAG TPA: hypothetical protein VFS67_29740 [Polyangiaceae bacterium]|nr:hypothetical protein [Polyangiaceae bacterium]
MPINAPRIHTTLPADAWLHIADITNGDQDLTSVSGAGKFAAQRVRLFNDTAGALVAVLIPEQRRDSNGSEGVASQTISVPAGEAYDVPVPIKKIVASGSGALQADAFWWFGNSLEINK